MKHPLTLIIGCTASGKGKLAFTLAQRWGAEIMSVDSMKVYRRMDIGTAKPSRAARQTVRHHLVDVVEPSEAFSVGRFVEMADAVIADCRRLNRPLIAVGGTAMYLRALLEGLFKGPPANQDIRTRLKAEAMALGSHILHQRLASLDAEAAGRIHPNDLKRLVRALEVYELTGRPISSFHDTWRTGKYRHAWRIIGLRRDRQDAATRINRRVQRMADEGLAAEVESLLAEPAGLSPQAAQAVGYAEIIAYLRDECDLTQAIEKIKVNTRRLAKSQRTWFRSFAGVEWFEVGPAATVEQVADNVEAAGDGQSIN